MEKRNTKNNFFIAFWKLYEKKNIEKISIRELCETAGYNRTTFYVYFHDIYDLLDEAVTNLVSPFRDNINFLQSLQSLVDSNSIEKIFLTFLNKNNKYIQLLINNNHHYILEDKVKEIIISKLKENIINEANSSIYIDYIIEYQISAIFGVLRYWFKDKNAKISKEELAHMLFEISTQGVFLIISQQCTNVKLSPSDYDKQVIDNIIQSIKEKKH